MPVGVLTLEIHIDGARSLKDKRQVLRSLKDRLRRHHNVAVAELDYQDTWHDARVGVVTISGSAQYVEQTLQGVLGECDRLLGRDLVDHSIEIV